MFGVVLGRHVGGLGLAPSSWAGRSSWRPGGAIRRGAWVGGPPRIPRCWGCASGSARTAWC